MTLPEPDRHTADGLLVQRAQAGDEAAFAEIYSKHVQAIYRYVSNRIGDATAAEDLTSEVFLRAVEALPRYQHRGAPLAAWLYRIARDRVVDFHRANSRHPSVELEDTLFDSSPDPEALLMQKAESGRLRQALAHITPEQRDVLFFRFGEGFSLERTAGIMGKTTGAIKALQFRALQALARLLK